MEYVELLDSIMKKGHKIAPRGEEIKELMHVTLNVKDNFYTFPGVREIDTLLNYWKKEFAWYMCGDRDGSYIEQYARLWSRIKNEDNTLNSNYGHLVFYNKTSHPSNSLQAMEYNPGKPIKLIETLTPFEWALRSLKNDKDTRQALITYNTGGFNFVGNRDYICTQHQAFFIRNNVLNCYIALRSSDAIFGLPYNMPWWSIVTQMLYLNLVETYPDLILGDTIVTIYSAHVYRQHYELVNKMLNTRYRTYKALIRKTIPLHNSYDYYLQNFDNLICVLPGIEG